MCHWARWLFKNLATVLQWFNALHIKTPGLPTYPRHNIVRDCNVLFICTTWAIFQEVTVNLCVGGGICGILDLSVFVHLPGTTKGEKKLWVANWRLFFCGNGLKLLGFKSDISSVFPPPNTSPHSVCNCLRGRGRDSPSNAMQRSHFSRSIIMKICPPLLPNMIHNIIHNS